MRQRLTIILTFVVILGLLVMLNLVTYVKEEGPKDTELTANRSTYHAGPTGSRALYDFLSESGYKVMRWREPPDKLLGESGRGIRTLAVIGRTQVPFTEDQAKTLLEWVSQGGRFVLVDRLPDESLLPNSGNWMVSARVAQYPGIDVDPADPRDMTETATALAPVQPTPLTHDVQSVMPSRFASRIDITPSSGMTEVTGSDAGTGSPAPVVHIANRQGALLVDYRYGKGQIILLSDPYLVSNGGIGLKDNLQLAINTLAGPGGLVAFDEYHQGRGVNRNALASYFAGTPVLAIAGQFVLLALLILWSRARRFGRPLPLVQIDRRSSLEFVASMSELQERSRAFDLAIENIYTRTRRALARYAGVDYNSPRALIASRVALRSPLDAQELETLMRQCEETINGAPVNWRQSVDMVRRLRQVERRLGLRMRSRDVRQAAENI
jgi:hypothetical protein